MSTPLHLRDAHVVIVGMGLMGASLGYDLRGYCRKVTGIVRRPEAIDSTLASGCVDDVTMDIRAAISVADVVVLATPVRTILRQINDLGPLMKPGCVLLDMGSTKERICQAMDNLPEDIQPVGGHPMCGKEKAGIEAAEPGLYYGCTFVLCPLPRTSDQALALIHEMVAHIHAHPMLLEPQRHDRLVAAISHLPYLGASALVWHVMNVAASDPLVWEVAATGFRDSTRVAASDVQMLLDILLTNRESVLEAVDNYINLLASFQDALLQNNEENLAKQLEGIAKARRNWMLGAKTH